MIRNRKETAWKKSRKFGDVKGGRTRPKLADNIFNRKHNLQAPKEGEETPIYILDNPSREFYFPVSIDEIKEFLNKLPVEHSKNLTHIWLRKMSKKEYEKEGSYQGCFICGSGVQLIVLYPFPKNLTMQFGRRKPPQATLKWYSAYNPDLKQANGNWHLKWTEDQIKRYYLEGLLLHEIGHKVDSIYKRFWSKSYSDKAEKYANNFAYYWGDKIRNEIK